MPSYRSIWCKSLPCSARVNNCNSSSSSSSTGGSSEVTPLGITAKATPVTASVPGTDNNFHLPGDGTLRYIATQDSGASGDGGDGGAQLSFHGGITRG